MIALWVILAILAALVAIIVFGRVGLRITCREHLTVSLSVCGIRYPLYPERTPKKKPPRDLSKCHNPDAVLQRELKKQEKTLEKARQRRLEKKAKNLCRRLDEGKLTTEAFWAAQSQFTGLYRHVLALTKRDWDEKKRQEAEKNTPRE